MHTFNYLGLGTSWSIIIDSQIIPHNLHKLLGNQILHFENQYSRFLPNSEVTKLNQSATNQTISPDLKKMLTLGLKLTSLTDGFFDLNIASLISGLGYDANYSFVKNQSLLDQPRGTYLLKKNTLIRHGPVHFDLGSLGKGYLVDKIAAQLQLLGLSSFLINGGGDIYGTSKSNQSPWQIALEHPLKPKHATAIISLKNQAVATSSSQKRRFNQLHHLINPKTKSSISSLLSVTTLASKAAVADATATAIFVSPPKYWSIISQKMKIEYYAIDPNLTPTTSKKFPHLFT